MLGDGAVLVCPPLTTACEPDPSVVALSGHLQAKGLASKVVDANLRYQQALFTLELPALFARWKEAREERDP